ncbi:unnamed protein product [Callosobruchus maculatus]|uniref:Uncharacterized protein n=1 Tax=Callosobruchus maculatus TaxID=64391 RepID=A0A653CFF7_CALMS|nr:unnamed protein product [Callosobruchus maculatus]
MKAYKFLQAFKYYEAGYVQQTMAKMMNTNCYVVMGKTWFHHHYVEES